MRVFVLFAEKDLTMGSSGKKLHPSNIHRIREFDLEKVKRHRESTLFLSLISSSRFRQFLHRVSLAYFSQEHSQTAKVASWVRAADLELKSQRRIIKVSRRPPFVRNAVAAADCDKAKIRTYFFFAAAVSLSIALICLSVRHSRTVTQLSAKIDRVADESGERSLLLCVGWRIVRLLCLHAWDGTKEALLALETHRLAVVNTLSVRFCFQL